MERFRNQNSNRSFKDTNVCSTACRCSRFVVFRVIENYAPDLAAMTVKSCPRDAGACVCANVLDDAVRRRSRTGTRSVTSVGGKGADVGPKVQPTYGDRSNIVWFDTHYNERSNEQVHAVDCTAAHYSVRRSRRCNFQTSPLKHASCTLAEITTVVVSESIKLNFHIALQAAYVVTAI